MTLANQVALVTGGARRVGRAIALELARGGCDLAVHYRHSRGDAEEVVQQVRGWGRRAVPVTGDLAVPGDCPRIVEQTVGELGRLDILVNNASAFLAESADTIDGFSSGAWEHMLRVNLVAPAALIHHALPHLRESENGRVVNLCDIAGDRPWSDHLAYCCSKAGLAALTKGLARTLAPEVRVNGVAPGIAVFPDEYSPELRRKLVARVPLQRPGSPEEVARLVRFLVESADYITGEIVRIDGGRALR